MKRYMMLCNFLSLPKRPKLDPEIKIPNAVDAAAEKLFVSRVVVGLFLLLSIDLIIWARSCDTVG